MAGTNPAFNAGAFRTAIKNTMRMGAPNATNDRVTFRWKIVNTYAHQDAATNPYDWGDAPATHTQHADVLVDAAVAPLGQAVAEYASVGELNPQKIELTLLDVDFAQVDGAAFVLWGEALFVIDYVAPPIALFDVNVYSVFCSAVDL